MHKLVVTASAALLLGLASATAAPLRAPDLNASASVATTKVMHDGMGMRRHHMMGRHMMMRRHMMRHRMHHRMMRHHGY
jgi:hypothetical protein